MGKPKLKSTFRALQDAIFGSKPAGSKTIKWVCIHQAKTDSFREVYKSFNSVYYSSSFTASSDPCTSASTATTDPTDTAHTPSAAQISGDGSSSNSASSSPSTAKRSADSQPAELLVLKGFISSRRFFFTPRTTKSIMEEARAQEEDGGRETDLPETKRGAEDCAAEVDFCKESLMMAVASFDPYMDFRISMEEMVRAHGLKEWPRLQDLLQCYLNLNDQTAHRAIVMAFVDLVMNISRDDPDEDGFLVKTKIPLVVS